MNTMKALKLLSYDKLDAEGKTYAEFTAMMIGAKHISDIRQKVAEHLNIRYNAYSLKAMEWLGLFDNIKMKRNIESPFDIVSDLMISKMMMKEEDRDMVVLQHNFVVKNKNGKEELIRSRMLYFGSL